LMIEQKEIIEMEIDLTKNRVVWKVMEL
jgi:hypothetical protein